MFYQVIFRILVFLLLEEYARDAFQLYSCTIDEAAEERAIAEGAVAVSAGTLFGVWVLKRIKTDTLEKAVYIFVGVTGTVMILQNLTVLK